MMKVVFYSHSKEKKYYGSVDQQAHVHTHTHSTVQSYWSGWLSLHAIL